MTRNAPLLTLLAGAVLGAGLFATNYLSTPGPVAVVAAVPVAGAVPAPVVVGTVPVPAATPTEVPAGTAFAGWTEGRRMTVAIVVTADEAVAYVCDPRDEVWLRGTATGGGLDLRSADGTATLTGTADADGASGTFALGDDRWAFTADATGVDAAVAAGRDDVADVADRAGTAY